MTAHAADIAETGAWERRFNIKKRARADGQAGAPPADARDLSAAERDVIAAVEDAARRVESEREAIARRLETELRRLTPAAPDIETPIAAARLDLRQIAGRLGPDIAAARADADEARRQLSAFRDANGLARPAIYPASRVLQAGLLMLAAAFEALFSASLFAETDERGLMGGAVIALGLSGANVTLGFLSGFIGLRYLQHVRAAAKIGGAAALAIGGGLSLALNLFAAAWRNQLTEAGKSALDTIDAAALFGLTSPQAVILLMLGAGIWVFAALKGYSGFDDPYPDYGKLDRAAAARAHDVSDLREDARAEMEEAVAEARVTIETGVAQIRAALAPMREAYDEAAGRIGDLDQGLRRTADSAAALIETYRRENAAARSAAPPAYFAEPPPLSAPTHDALAAAADLLVAAQDAASAAQADAAAKLEDLARDLDALSGALEGAGAAA
jgi:hypothetical protein